jgi:CRP/FNR family transcriptional regulator, cyclic AMP receptor protein
MQPNLLVLELRRIPLFADWPTDELVRLSRSTVQRRWDPGQFIVVQSEPGRVGFVILRGRVDVLLEWADGREFCLARLGPGDHFGEMSLLEPEPRSATIRAASAVELLVLRREDFLQHLLAEPATMLRLIGSLSQRLRRTDEQVAQLAFDDTAARLGRLLQLNAVEQPRGRVVEASQSELANMVGATRQTVARILGEWRRQGLIRTDRRKTLILDPDRLSTILESRG